MKQLALLAVAVVSSGQIFARADALAEGAAAEADPAPVEAAEKVLKEARSPDGTYRFLVDATSAPDLLPWVETEMLPVVIEWYPKIVEMLPSPGHETQTTVLLELLDDSKGHAAYALPGRIVVGVPFLRKQLDREAKGAVVHELVHVVQDYWLTRRRHPGAGPPSWVTEGIADQIRWFLYEPESRGAEITQRNFAKANYDSSYRITANFFNWVIENHESDLIRKLNEAARSGAYSDELWKEWTGHSLAELNTVWRTENAQRLEIDVEPGAS